jgi:hypothetical protein
MALNQALTDRVHALVLKAGKSKFYSSERASTINVLLEAESICVSAPGEISPPYQDLIGYRIALLRLRNVKDLSHEELRDVSNRLERASKEDDFGPWPYLYRLVALKKLKNKEALRACLQQALQAVAKESRLNDEIYQSDVADLDYPAIAQSHIFNALELAVFFCELDYSPLEGLLDSFMGSSNAFVPGVSAEALNWSMIQFEGGSHIHRSLPKPFIESQAIAHYNDAVARGHRALLLSVNLDGKIDQDGSRCTDPSNLRKWTRDVSTSALVDALHARFPNTTARYNRDRLQHLFGELIDFPSTGAMLKENATLIITLHGSAWLAGPDCAR